MTSHGWIILPTWDIRDSNKFHPVRYYVVTREEARILISHATATWLGLMKVLCPNKAPRIKRQVASVSKKAREPSDSSTSNSLSGPEHPPKVKYSGTVMVKEQQYEKPTSKPCSHGRKCCRGKPAHREEEGQVANRSVEFQSFQVDTKGATSMGGRQSVLPHCISTPSQSEITENWLSGLQHPYKVKYSYNNKQNISFQDHYKQHPPKVKYSLPGPPHPPKVKYFPEGVLKLVIRQVGETAYDSYIAEILYPLKSAIKPKKQTRFAGDPVSSVKTIPARRTRSHPPKWTIKAEDPDLLIPIELSQARAESDLIQDLGGDLSVVSPRESHQSEETLPTVPLGQFQAQRSDDTTTNNIAHFKTDTPSQSEINSTITENIVTFQTGTPSQREIFSETGTGTSSSKDMSHSDGDIPEEHPQCMGTQSEHGETSDSSGTSRTTTSS